MDVYGNDLVVKIPRRASDATDPGRSRWTTVITLRSRRPTDVARCAEITRNIIHPTTSMPNSDLQAPARPLPPFVTYGCYKRRKAHVWRLNDEDPESVRQPSLSRILPSSSFSGKAPLSNFGSAGPEKQSTSPILRMILKQPIGSVRQAPLPERWSFQSLASWGVAVSKC